MRLTPSSRAKQTKKCSPAMTVHNRNSSENTTTTNGTGMNQNNSNDSVSPSRVSPPPPSMTQRLASGLHAAFNQIVVTSENTNSNSGLGSRTTSTSGRRQGPGSLHAAPLDELDVSSHHRDDDEEEDNDDVRHVQARLPSTSEILAPGDAQLSSSNATNSPGGGGGLLQDLDRGFNRLHSMISNRMQGNPSDGNGSSRNGAGRDEEGSVQLSIQLGGGGGGAVEATATSSRGDGGGGLSDAMGSYSHQTSHQRQMPQQRRNSRMESDVSTANTATLMSTEEEGRGVGGGGGGGSPADPLDDHETTPLMNDDGGGNAAMQQNAAGPPTRLDLNVIVLWLEQALPFLLLLFCFFLKEHFVEIWFFGLHSFMFLKANQIVKRTIAHRGGDSHSNKKLILVTFLLAVSSFILLFVVFPHQKLWASMILIPPTETLNVWHSLFRCALCDVSLRQFSIIIKATQMLIWKPKPGRMFRRQGHFLTFVEHTTMLYSLLIPVPIWYRYFQNAESFGQWFSSVSTGCYLTMKLSTMFERVVHFLGALKVLLQPVDQYGSRASKEDVAEVGDCCSICQDTMTMPLKLRCRHIFCEECIGEWLDRDTTCPLCRAVVKPEVVRSYSDGSSGWIITVF